MGHSDVKPTAGWVRLSRPAAATIRARAADGGARAVLYRAVHDDLAGRADPDTLRWYRLAAQVNDPNAGTAIHYLTRSYLAIETVRQSGVAVAPWGAAMQRCSDAIADAVLGGVIAGDDRVGTFATVGPVETRRLTRALVPGAVLGRAVWPAYTQLAAACGARWLYPVKRFADDGYLGDLSAAERLSVLRSALLAAAYSRWCLAAGRWVTLPKPGALGVTSGSLAPRRVAT